MCLHQTANTRRACAVQALATLGRCLFNSALWRTKTACDSTEPSSLGTKSEALASSRLPMAGKTSLYTSKHSIGAVRDLKSGRLSPLRWSSVLKEKRERKLLNQLAWRGRPPRAKAQALRSGGSDGFRDTGLHRRVFGGSLALACAELGSRRLRHWQCASVCPLRSRQVGSCSWHMAYFGIYAFSRWPYGRLAWRDHRAASLKA